MPPHNSDPNQNFQSAMSQSYSLDEIFDIEHKLVFLVGKSGSGKAN